MTRGGRGRGGGGGGGDIRMGAGNERHVNDTVDAINESTPPTDIANGKQHAVRTYVEVVSSFSQLHYHLHRLHHRSTYNNYFCLHRHLHLSSFTIQLREHVKCDASCNGLHHPTSRREDDRGFRAKQHHSDVQDVQAEGILCASPRPDRNNSPRPGR
eukprot:761082-Hanusia_phi.AAC.9